MMNVDQITSRLAKLPDQALQQYAAMHKNDPYIMALAVAESNRRKEMRQAAQGAQGGMEPPKVVDAALEEMTVAPQALPEESGIARLPAGDMNFADGGIVAFDGGGSVYDRYRTMYSRDPRLLGSDPNEPLSEALLRLVPAAGALPELFNVPPAPGSEIERRRREAEIAQKDALMRERYVGRSSADRPVTPPTAVATPAVADTSRTSAAAPGAAAPGAPTNPRAPAMPGGIGDINAMLQKALAAQKYDDPAKADVEKLGQTLVAGRERRLAEFDADTAKQGDVFKGRDARIAARESELLKQKDTNTGLAFLNAGLAIMSTPGGLATAIGKGARVGTEQFAAGLDKIRAAQDRLEEAKDKVEELRLNRADMTAKERRALTADIDNAKADVLKLSIEGTRMAAGVTEKRAAEIVGNQVKVGIAQLEQAGANARNAATVAASNRNPQLDIIKALQGDPKLLETYQAMHGDKGGIMTEYIKWLKENPTYMGRPEEEKLKAFMQAKAATSVLRGASVSDQPTGRVLD